MTADNTAQGGAQRFREGEIEEVARHATEPQRTLYEHLMEMAREEPKPDHQHEHEHKGGLLLRLVKPFKHDHSGYGPSGALVVEGPDDVGHVGTVIDTAVRGVQHGSNDPSRPVTVLEALQRIGTSSSPGEAVFSVGFSSPIALLGVYTFAVSLQEIHEAGHNKAHLNEELAQIRARRDALRGHQREQHSGDTGKLLEMHGAVLQAVNQRLTADLQQNRRDRRFWQFSASSGALVATKAITDVISGVATLKPSIAIPATVASTLGGVATTAVAAPAAGVAMGVGAMSALSARAAQKNLKESPLRDVLGAIDRGTPLTDKLSDFAASKAEIRKNIYKRVGDWSSAFTASNGVSLAGAVLGSTGGLLLGTGLAVATHGVATPAIPQLVIAGGAVGATGSLGALSSVWVLPYGHMKMARYHRYEGRARSQESSLVAMANLHEFGRGFEVQGQRLAEIQAKHSGVQELLKSAAWETHTRYTPKQHKSDPRDESGTPAATNTRSNKLVKSLNEKGLEKWMRDERNFPRLQEWMRDSIAIENGEQSYLRRKDSLRKGFLDINVADNETGRFIRESVLPQFSESARSDKARQEQLNLLSGRVEALNARGTIDRAALGRVLDDFLTLQGAPNGKNGVDAFKRAAKYSLKDERSLDRDARGELFASVQFAATIAAPALAVRQEFEKNYKLPEIATGPTDLAAVVLAAGGIPEWEAHYGKLGVSGTFTAVAGDESRIRFGRDSIPKEELSQATGLAPSEVNALIGQRGSIKRSQDPKQRLQIGAATQRERSPSQSR